MTSFFKHKIISLLFLVLVVNAKAQFFGLLNTNPANEYLTALSYPVDGKYRVVNMRPDVSIPMSIPFCQILVYNTNQQLIDSINFIKGIIPQTTEPIKIGNRLYWANNFRDTLNPNVYAGQLSILELDTTYQLLNIHKVHAVSTSPFVVLDLVKVSDYFFIGKYELFKDTSTVYKLNGQFVVLDSAVFKGKLTQISGIGDKLLLQGSKLPAPCLVPTTDQVQKLLMDTALNVLNCFTIDSTGQFMVAISQQLELFNRYSRLVPISKTKTFAMGYWPTYYASTVNPYPDEYAVIVNCIIDHNNNILNTAVFSNPGVNTNYVLGSNIVQTRQNEIISVGCVGNDLTMPSLLQIQHSKIIVIRLDTMGNVVWTKQYGGDMYYHPKSIAFTQDGGYVIAGLRYAHNETPHPFIMESFLLKLNANGDFGDVGIFENGKMRFNNIKCYPNPSAGELFFDLPFAEEIQIEIFNNLSQNTLFLPKYQSREMLDISAFPKGVYFYRIKAGENTYLGKFIRE